MIHEPAVLKDGFRQAMRRLAASVHVVATAREGRRYGLTATAVTSLSMDPPSLLVCVNQNATTHHALAHLGQRFSVNLLAPGQEEVSSRFGTPTGDSEARFAASGWSASDDGTPLLQGAASSLECEVVALHPHGTHTVIIGEVRRVHLGGTEALLYANGGYTVAAAGALA